VRAGNSGAGRRYSEGANNVTDQRGGGQGLREVEVHHGWVRFDEGHMGLPVPAVAMPTADLYQPDLAALGFVRVAAVFAGAGVTRTRHVLANISDGAASSMTRTCTTSPSTSYACTTADPENGPGPSVSAAASCSGATC